MKIRLHSTSQIVNINGIEHRVWEGTTERGIPITAFVSRVAVRDDQDTSQFERELIETPAPRAAGTWPARLTIRGIN